MILGFEDSDHLCQAIAKHMNLPHDLVSVHRFPDGESKVSIPTELAETVYFVRSLHQPNNKLIELFLAESWAKRYGCKKAILVAPYLGYMRQDYEFQPGEVVSQSVIGDWLSQRFDGVITIDPHLHRIDRLEQAYTHCKAVSLSATETIAKHLSETAKNAVLVGPDAESEQWVSVVAQYSGLDYCVANKVRSGDRKVQVELPNFPFDGRNTVLVDDVISSGHTIKQAALALKEAGCGKVFAACTHALFAPGAEQALKEAGVEQVLSCNTIEHDSNCMDVSSLLATQLQRHFP